MALVYSPGSAQKPSQECGAPPQILELDVLVERVRTIPARAEAV
jgi:hypothetical protein